MEGYFAALFSGTIIITLIHLCVATFISGFFIKFKKSLMVTAKMKQAFRNLRINPGRTGLVIIALVVGLWGLGSLLVTYTILKNDLAENYLNTQPPHAILYSKNFDRLDEALRNASEIDKAEFRDLSMERIESAPNQWIPLWLFGVENFRDLKLAQFYKEAGQKAPEPGTMLIERNGLKISDIEMGSETKISVTGPKIIEVPISGISFDPALAPSTMDHWIYGYVDKTTYTKLTGKKINQRLILRYKNVNALKDVQLKTKKLAEKIRSKGINLDKIQIPAFNAHPHQFQLDSLMILQGGIGLLAFLMGAVLVWQLIVAMLAQQVRQIGIFKAIGATRLQVFNIYFIIILTLGVLSTIIAIPLSIWSGYSFAGFVAQQLNFEILTENLPIHIYIYLIAAGMLLPILASMTTILRGIRLPVASALADYGVKTPTGNKELKKSWLPTSGRLAMIIRNTFRRRSRLAVTVLTMALGVAIFSTGFNLRQALVVLLSDIENAMNFDAQLKLRNHVPVRQALLPFNSLKYEYRVETWSGEKGTLETEKESLVNNRVEIIALPYNTDLIDPMLIKGRWLNNNAQPEVVINSPMLEYIKNPIIGGNYRLKNQEKSLDIKLVGIVKQFGRPAVYIDQNQFDQYFNPDRLVNRILLTSKTQKNDHQLTQNIEKIIEGSNLNVSSVISLSGLTKIIYDHLNIILSLLTMLAVLVLIMGSLGMASATGINIMERTREIGVLRAIGATPKNIYTIFIGEGLMIVFISILIGMVFSWPMSIIVSDFFGKLILETSLDFAFSITGSISTIAVTFLFSWLASRIPATKAISISNREALSYE